MSFTFGTASKARLITCHEDIRIVMESAITDDIDFSVLEGHRSEELQNQYFDNKVSKVRFPDSKHNSIPSRAIDIVPYPVDWEDLQRFRDLAVVINYHAWKQGVRLEWGGTWGWKDHPHWQLRD